MTHTLKCRNDYFSQVGDWVLLREWDEKAGYSGRKINARVRYILRNAEEFGIMPGYCVFGLELFQNYRGII